MQLSLLDAIHGPPIRRPIDPVGSVEQEPIDEVLTFRPPKWRLAWSPAVIELHRDRESGLWMWAVQLGLHSWGTGYRVGVKWGRFAETREAALFHAVAEARAHLGRKDALDPTDAKLARQMGAWLDEVSP